MLTGTRSTVLASPSMAVRGSAVELEPISDGRSTGPKMQIMQRPTSQATVGLHESRISGVVVASYGAELRRPTFTPQTNLARLFPIIMYTVSLHHTRAA